MEYVKDVKDYETTGLTKLAVAVAPFTRHFALVMIQLRALLTAALRPGVFRYFGALGARGLEVLGKFGLYMLAARLMGAHNSGLFFLCLTWVNLASTAARMGLERAMSRHIAAELAVGHGSAARRALTMGLGWTAVASLRGRHCDGVVGWAGCRCGFSSA